MNYNQLISIENLFQAYHEFKKGKKKRFDLQIFERNLEDNLFNLYSSLRNKTYQHGKYEDFYVNDPKRRHIHKTCVSDRIVHHLLYKYLYEIYDNSFIYDSYSCRLNKGTHKGVKRLYQFTRKVSKNYTEDCFALKCDIKQFFASVDHQILLKLLEKKIEDEDILWLLTEVIASFSSNEVILGVSPLKRGIPLGNLTSQIFANIYMNKLDQFIKHELKIKYYLRYADDFIVLSNGRGIITSYINILYSFLGENLKLELHPNKVTVRKLSWGIDFLGYIVLPHYILPRTKTKKRLFRKIEQKIEEYEQGKISEFSLSQTSQSYSGYLKHANTYKLISQLKENYYRHFSFV